MIEKTLEKILSELEKLNAAFATVLAAPAQQEQKPVQAAKPTEAKPDPFTTITEVAPKVLEVAQVKEAAPAPITREQVGTALVGLATDKGREVAMAVLAQFGGATKLGDIKADDYPKLAEAIKGASNL